MKLAEFANKYVMSFNNEKNEHWKMTDISFNTVLITNYGDGVIETYGVTWLQLKFIFETEQP